MVRRMADADLRVPQPTPQRDALVDQFAEYLATTRDASEHTLKAYLSDLDQFCEVSVLARQEDRA